MSLYHNHLVSDRSNSKGKGSKRGEKAELDRLLDPSYSNPSSLARGSTDLGSTYIDAQGNEHDSRYSAYDGLAALNGRRFKGRAIDRDSSTDSDDGQLDTLPSMIGASMARSTTARSSASHRNRNRPASEMTMNPGIIDGVDYTPGASRRAQARERAELESSDAGTGTSSSRYPATTTRTSKSRRSTLLSQTTTYTDYPTSEAASENASYLEPPPPSRYSKSAYIKNQPRGGPSYPSPPSSVVSSVTPQIYPETPAQAHQRRSKELARPLTSTKHQPIFPPPPPSSAYGSEKVGNSTGLLERGGYVPTKWKEEKKGRRGAVEEAYRPPDHEEEWTPGCADNLKRSWGEIKLATRFGVFRAKKKLERSVGHGV
ncbi:hypothetical protein BDY24DRAFT_381272 [Mrakia frigida]|uniref:uncharacterized protein n=1 Tax=Mrakia frigida TaxID=29902 RepID=UPI003FCBFCEB